MRQIDTTRQAQRRLVRSLRASGITDEAVLEAIGSVPRHELVPAALRSDAYVDAPLPIGREQTISQPYVVALMTQALRLRAGQRVLEIGTGSGYQAAILATLGCEVFTVERIREIADRARRDLDRLGHRVHCRIGDGSEGWPDEAPFDAIMVTAASKTIPQPLLDQLGAGGHLVIPLGTTFGVQHLTVVHKDERGHTREHEIAAVRFVPLLDGVDD